MFGDSQPISLRLLEEQDAFQQLEGLKYQLEDSCFPLLQDIITTTKSEEAFEDADFVFELAGRPPIMGTQCSYSSNQFKVSQEVNLLKITFLLCTTMQEH